MTTKTIIFKENEYQLKYPTVGQLIDIRVLEQQLSKGTVRDLLTGLNADVDGYIYITTISHIQVLLPELVKDLKVPMKDMDLLDFQDFVELYTEQIAPWMVDWNEKIKEKMKPRGE